MSGSLVFVLCISALILVAVGIVGLVFPERVQTWALNSHAEAGCLWRWNPFIDWMRSSAYLLSLRIIGGMAILMAGVLLVAVARGVWP